MRGHFEVTFRYLEIIVHFLRDQCSSMDKHPNKKQKKYASSSILSFKHTLRSILGSFLGHLNVKAYLQKIFRATHTFFNFYNFWERRPQYGSSARIFLLKITFILSSARKKPFPGTKLRSEPERSTNVCRCADFLKVWVKVQFCFVRSMLFNEKKEVSSSIW